MKLPPLTENIMLHSKNLTMPNQLSYMKVCPLNTLSIINDKDSSALPPLKCSLTIETCDTKKLPSQLKHSNAITSPAEASYYRKLNFTDANIQNQTKDQLHISCDTYRDIFLKNGTDIGKTDLVQMSLQPKYNFKPLNKKSYTLPL